VASYQKDDLCAKAAPSRHAPSPKAGVRNKRQPGTYVGMGTSVVLTAPSFFYLKLAALVAQSYMRVPRKGLKQVWTRTRFCFGALNIVAISLVYPIAR
jgi:hypothetical protein